MGPGSAAHRFALRSVRGTQTRKAGSDPGLFSFVIASEAKQSSFVSAKTKLDCFVAEPVIGRAFARPVGSSP
jgi:hypothetical protein